MTSKRTLLTLLAIASLPFVAACGPVISEQLPLAPQVHVDGDDPLISSACYMDEPHCEDTVVADDPGTDSPRVRGDEPLPPPETSSGLAFEGGLTVSAALLTDAIGTLAVQGHLFIEDQVVSLCEELAPGGERYECGGAQVQIEGLDLGPYLEILIPHDGISYSQDPITVFGELVDGVLNIDGMVSG